ncbi:hypothetical protein vseg_003747 [Gypsophila vaccaria]
MRLHSTSLINLSLVGCRGITCLNLTCPYLEQVRLDGCDHLERASFLPTMNGPINNVISVSWSLSYWSMFLLSWEKCSCSRRS